MKRMWSPVLAAVVLAAGRSSSQSPVATTNFLDEPFGTALFTTTERAGYEDAGAAIPGPEVRMREIDAAVLLPVWSSGADILLAGAAAKWNRFEFTDPALDDEDLHGLSVPLGWARQGDGPWSGWASIAPGLFGDFRGGRDDFKVQGSLLASCQWSPRLSLSLGAAYDSAFGQDRLYPLGGLAWRGGESWLLNLVFPSVSAWWRPSAGWAAYADLRPAGDTWKVRGDTDDDRLEFTLETWRAGAGIEVRVWNALWAHLGAGLDLARHYEFTRGSTAVLDADVDDGWFLRAGVVLR